MAKFKDYDQNQGVLFPTYLDEDIPEDHISRIINEIVERLDVNSITEKYSEIGANAYHPRMLLKVLFYSYSTGTFSSRKLSALLKTDIAAMWLSGRQYPDFRTISDFRKDNLEEINQLFVQVIQLCLELGMVELGHISIDGSIFRANASKHKAMSYGRIKEDKSKLEKQISELIEKAQEIDEQEDELYGDSEGLELPEELKRKEQRLKKIDEAMQELQKRANQKSKKKITDKDQYNFTDPESRMMMTRNEGPQQSYNNQIAVDQKEGVIIAADVTNSASDKGQLQPIVEKVKENCGRPEILTADAGYFSASNIEYLAEEEIDGYISSAREKSTNPKNPYDKKYFTYDAAKDLYICPQGNELLLKAKHNRKDGRVEFFYQGTACLDCPAKSSCVQSKSGKRKVTRDDKEPIRDAMRSKVKTEEGKQIYAQRKSIVEPVYGQIKEAQGFRRFSFRGLSKVKFEFTLVCMCHNIRKIGNKLKQDTQYWSKLRQWMPKIINQEGARVVPSQ